MEAQIVVEERTGFLMDIPAHTEQSKVDVAVFTVALRKNRHFLSWLARDGWKDGERVDS